METLEAGQRENAAQEGRLSTEIAELIRRERMAAGFTQQQFAERCGSTQGRISDIECGHVGISVATLERMAQGLGKHLEVRFV